MKHWLYNGLCHIAVPAVAAKLWWRSRKQPAYGERIQERFGYYSCPPVNAPGLIWLHCVSVGEFMAAVPLINSLLDRGYNLLVTTTTPTGSEQVQKKLGDRVLHVYAPYDIPSAIQRFLRFFKPSLLLIMETELWPNILRQCRLEKIPSVLINGRLSERSANGYARLGSVVREMLANLSCALMQYPADAKRLTELGMAQRKVQVCGSVKFDVTITEQQRHQANALRLAWPQSQVWLTASTHPGEEAQIARAVKNLKAQWPQSLLILAPRHPERCPEILPLLGELNVILRSSGESITESTDVLLLDTLGELSTFYGTADVAFVGGSLVEHGGHNLVEPAVWAKPVITGPHFFNFASMAEQMLEYHALEIVEDADRLVTMVDKYFSHPNLALDQGNRAQQFFSDNQGALPRIIESLAPFLPER